MSIINVVHGAWGTKGQTVEGVIRWVARKQAIDTLLAANLGAVTDNSTGTAANGFVIPAPATAVAASGSNLADSASFNTAHTTVKNAIATLYAKANAIAAAVSAPGITYVGNGTANGNTVAAITKTVTAATTGAPLADYEKLRLATNGQLTSLYALANRLGAVFLNKKLKAISGATGANIATVATGANVAPGVSVAKAQADLIAWADAIAAITAQLNLVLSASALPPILVLE